MIRRILCVCKGNTCRSPMLGRLLLAAISAKMDAQTQAGNLVAAVDLLAIKVESAGTYVGVSSGCLHSPANEHAIACMAERGFNITDHISRPLSTICINDFDLIVCVGNEEFDFVAQLHPRGAILLAQATDGGVPNPWQKGLPAYQHCAAILEIVAGKIVDTFL